MATTGIKRYIIKDVMEAFIESDSGNSYFLGATTDSSVLRNMDKELIKAGIGSKTVGTISEDQGWEINVTTGLYYKDIMEVVLGNEFESLTDFTIQEITEEPDGTFTATEKTVAGEVLDLEAGAIPKNAKLQLHTVAYDPETNEIVADIYWIFDKVSPSGEFEQNYSMGENNIQEISFDALVPTGQKSYGKYAIIPVDQPDPIP